MSKEKLHIDPELLRSYMLGGSHGKDDVNLNKSSDIVDLHFEKLPVSQRKLHHGDKLSIQIAHFEQKLENAIAHGQEKLIVIHGKGSGKLRNEIHALLRKHPHVKSFKLLNDMRYSNGATEIIL